MKRKYIDSQIIHAEMYDKTVFMRFNTVIGSRYILIQCGMEIRKRIEKMLVSIVTVCYNGEKSIKETIESVLVQTYDELEYILIDGKSNDKTMDIVRKYQQKFETKGIIYRYISEPDYGMYDAMNKGIRMAEGELVGIINSGDWYEPSAVECAVQNYALHPYDLFYADLRVIGRKRSFIKKAKDSRWVTSRYWNHPTTFISRQVYKQYEYKTENIHDDWDLILRIRKAGCKVCVANTVLANFYRDGISHEKSIKKAIERAGIKYRIYRDNGYSRWYVLECYGIEAAKLLL